MTISLTNRRLGRRTGKTALRQLSGRLLRQRRCVDQLVLEWGSGRNMVSSRDGLHKMMAVTEDISLGAACPVRR